jgi:predicted nucleic acid-binding protein
MILIDANIWAYYFDSTLSEHTHVKKPVESALRRHHAVINTTITIETLHYLVRRLGPLAGGEKGRIFLAYDLPLLLFDNESIDLTHRKLCEYHHLGIGGRDASLLATMEQHEITTIMTHDQAFKQIPDITVKDPLPT